MMFSIFYFSGTGNTKWVSNTCKGILTEKGFDSKMYSIEEEIVNLNEIILNSDYIGIAYPICGANIPRIMREFILKLKELLPKDIEKRVFVISTAGYVDGFGPFSIMTLFKKSGLKLRGYISTRISNNVSTPTIKANPVGSDELKIRLEMAEKKINELVDRLILGEKYIKNIGPYLLGGLIIRKVSKKGLRNSYLAHSVDLNKCRRCMVCVKKCPTKSIEYKDDKFVFLPSCTACMRCYNFCPTYAIYHQGKYADPEVYFRYKGPIGKW